MEKKIGVYMCTGCEIGASLNMEALSTLATDDSEVPVCKTHEALCGKEGVELIKKDIADEGVNAVVVAACSSRVKYDVFDFGNEVLLALHAEQRPPAWAVEALDELPSLMGQARQRESALERAMLDMAEALVLEHSVGEVFDGYVVAVDERRGRARVQIADPAVIDDVSADGRRLGEHLRLKVERVDVAERLVDFTVVG